MADREPPGEPAKREPASDLAAALARIKAKQPTSGATPSGQGESSSSADGQKTILKPTRFDDRPEVAAQQQVGETLGAGTGQPSARQVEESEWDSFSRALTGRSAEPPTQGRSIEPDEEDRTRTIRAVQPTQGSGADTNTDTRPGWVRAAEDLGIDLSPAGQSPTTGGHGTGGHGRPAAGAPASGGGIENDPNMVGLLSAAADSPLGRSAADTLAPAPTPAHQAAEVPAVPVTADAPASTEDVAAPTPQVEVAPTPEQADIQRKDLGIIMEALNGVAPQNVSGVLRGVATELGIDNPASAFLSPWRSATTLARLISDHQLPPTGGLLSAVGHDIRQRVLAELQNTTPELAEQANSNFVSLEAITGGPIFASGEPARIIELITNGVRAGGLAETPIELVGTGEELEAINLKDAGIPVRSVGHEVGSNGRIHLKLIASQPPTEASSDSSSGETDEQVAERERGHWRSVLITEIDQQLERFAPPDSTTGENLAGRATRVILNDAERFFTPEIGEITSDQAEALRGRVTAAFEGAADPALSQLVDTEVRDYLERPVLSGALLDIIQQRIRVIELLGLDKNVPSIGEAISNVNLILSNARGRTPDALVPVISRVIENGRIKTDSKPESEPPAVVPTPQTAVDAEPAGDKKRGRMSRLASALGRGVDRAFGIKPATVSAPAVSEPAVSEPAVVRVEVVPPVLTAPAATEPVVTGLTASELEARRLAAERAATPPVETPEEIHRNRSLDIINQSLDRISTGDFGDEEAQIVIQSAVILAGIPGELNPEASEALQNRIALAVFGENRVTEEALLRGLFESFGSNIRLWRGEPRLAYENIRGTVRAARILGLDKDVTGLEGMLGALTKATADKADEAVMYQVLQDGQERMGPAIDRMMGLDTEVSRMPTREFSQQDVADILKVGEELAGIGLALAPREQAALQAKIRESLANSPYSRRALIRDEVTLQLDTALEANDSQAIRRLISAVDILGFDSNDTIPGLTKDSLNELQGMLPE